MLFRNEFRDLIETITIPFKPIRTEPVRGDSGENTRDNFTLIDVRKKF